MKKAIVKLKSTSAYSQSRMYSHDFPKLEKESSEAHDIRCWREHQHYDRKTEEIYIPPMALKSCLMEVSQYLGEKIPGRGNKTWTAFFTAGVLCYDNAFLGVFKNDTQCEEFHCHADGKRTCGTRVVRRFPVIPEWETEAIFYILDETITESVFTRYLSEAGKFIGIGRFRPRNGGFYGRFQVVSVKWQDA